ncbi:class I SAM-dependent methyltransferase [Sphingobium lignivorans]|uniref:Cyclopropane fatty-acyl-phospholipid synthase-like methyltransferase n=1 Tax=Sphingobium lignivorans TaxID=2735886 RepID=A0ABR6NMF1_9SPHN|nr:methyltransferase domain-containing protein [Sphingobium lignivorans]MBB5987683.1 cyclopropane fatty-acyl-phospholipid synthase-like methyltransferase [Sphingobium lignivorans]
MMTGRGAWLVAALLPASLALAACDLLPSRSAERSASAQDFPRADRPVAPIISTRWSTEEARDRVNEAKEIMDRAGIRPGMTVADIGAGEGYYTVRLASRVGPEGRVLGQDIIAEVIDALGRRVTREDWSNVSVKLGTPDDPRLPDASFDRVFMIHMYHEIAEPYAFLWRLYPALKPDGQVIVVDIERPTDQHGTPSALLRCEFEAVGFRFVGMEEHTAAGGYLARFQPGPRRAEPGDIATCRLARRQAP